VISFTPLPGCFSPFPRGTLRYRSRGVFSLGGWSPQLPTGYLVPRGTRDAAHPPPGFRLRGSHPLRPTLPGPSPRPVTSGVACGSTPPLIAQPRGRNACRLTRPRFGLLPVRSPLLGELSLFLAVLRCFSSRTYLLSAYVFSARWRGFTPPGCPIRVSTVQCLPAAHRRFSQLATPFFGPARLGIHPRLSLA